MKFLIANLGRMRGAVLAGLLMAGCSSVSGDDPISRSLTWFAYVAGHGFEQACRSTPGERYRAVFNAEYTAQVRTYDLVTNEGGAVVRGRVFRGSLRADAAFTSAVEGLVGREATVRLDDAALAEFRRAVAASSPYHGVAPTYLRSDSYYWILLSCVDGDFEARAFTGPAATLEALPIRRFLLAHDPTGVPVRVQRPVFADRLTNFGLAYSHMEAESVDRAQGAGPGALFQFRFENGRISRPGF